MKNAHRSIAIVTCHIACAIKDRMDDDDFLRAIATVEAFSEKNVLDQRAQNMFSLLLYCSQKILQRVNCEQFFPEVEEKMLNLVMPSYLKVKDGDGNAGEVLQNQGKSNVENFLHDNLPKATLRGTVDEVLKFLDQDFCPSSCCCGSCVAFNVQSAICFVEATLGTSYTTGITAGAVRHFIKSKGVGCVGSVVRFRGSNKQVHAAHIQHGWFNSEDIAAMHEKLGLRKKKNARKETTSQTQTQEPTSEAVLEEPESEENLLTGQTQVQPDQDKEVHMIEQEQVQPDQDKEVHTIEQTQGSVLEEEGLVMTMTKRKRQKGGLVSTLYDKLHPGDVSGKRRRIQRKPPK